MDALLGSVEDLRIGLANLYNPRVVDRLPLARSLVRARRISAPGDLSDFLVGLIEQLRPAPELASDSLPARRYRYLQARYIAYRRHEDIAAELSVSPRQARRIHRDALESLAELIRRTPEITNHPDSVMSAVKPRKETARDLVPPQTTGSTGSFSIHRELDAVGRQAPASAIDLSAVIESVRLASQPMLDAWSITLRIEQPVTLRPVWFQRVNLRQVLLNMLLLQTRAVSGGMIELSVVQTPEETRLAMRSIAGDISAPVRPELVEVNQILDAARYLAALQGARLDVQPSAQRTVLASPDSVPLELVLRIPERASRTILVVDDNPHVGAMFAYMLEGSPYRAVQARTAERAIRLTREQQPAVVVLDVVMPTRDGWEILAVLRKDPAAATVPVVVCSVLPDRDLALALGAADFLGKPVSRERLLQVLGRIREPRGRPHIAPE